MLNHAPGRDPQRAEPARRRRPQKGTSGARFWILVLVALAVAGCAKYNTYYNAKRSFDRAEQVREDALKNHQDPPTPAGAQRADYEAAAKKAQKILDEYPGHGLTDDALFLQGKAFHRIEAYRQSIRKLNLLFQNFPATEYMEEALYIQALNFLLIGAVDQSQEYLDRLARNYPDSDYQAETRRVSGDNAFTLKRWEEAAAAYTAYLELVDDGDEDRYRIGLKLARCYWELEDYYAAAAVLQDMSQTTESAELAFQASLLRGRVHVRMADYEVVDLIVAQLGDEAEIYQAQGDVALLEAESLIAQGRADDAAPLLENMPTDWQTTDVKARAAEIMGDVFMERGDWVKARENYQAALVRKDVLDDEERVRQLQESLKDYLAAEQALPDAKGERVARLQLLQANSLLFGFQRPHMAATLYVEAAADTAADTTVAARAMYGAYVTYRDYLDEPDSAAMYRATLTETHPESPQAYAAVSDSSTNLFGYLLALRREQQDANYAALSEEERQALVELGDMAEGSVTRGPQPLEGVRRRMVYLGRRDNIVYPPPSGAVERIEAKRAMRVEEAAADAARQAEFDSLQAAQDGAAAGSVPATGALGGTEIGGPATAGQGDPRTGAAAGADQAREEGAGAADDAGKTDAGKTDDAKDGEKDDKDESDKKDEKKKKKDDDWDFLRRPGPGR